MKHFKPFIAAALVLLIASYSAIPVSAEELSSEKEEVIYIMADALGNVSDIEAVNIFSGGNIIDYGDYSAVKMLNTTDSITQDGNKITFSSNAGRVYYQGTMKNTEIPWNISIHFLLDGTEYSAADIAGKSGNLEIHFKVSQNEKCKDTFYKNYALQAAFTLDTDRCQNIIAEGATVANVGNNKQLGYTILPGKGIDTVIKADVTDFEMDAVSINGVRLNLNLEIDDSELTEKVDDVVNAITSIDSGAIQLNSGTKALSTATNTLDSKVGELYTGVGILAAKTGNLSSGLADIADKNEPLTSSAYKAYEGLCNAAAAALNSSLKEKGMEPVTLTPSTYSSVLMSLLNTMESSGIPSQLNKATAANNAAAEQILTLKEQLDSYGTFYQGLSDYTAAVSTAQSGAELLKQNMDNLYSNTDTLQTSVGKLNNAAAELSNGTQKLADGTSEFASQTSDIDTKISEGLHSMTSSIGGQNEDTVSFTSEQNNHVSSVQFVIKTKAIEKSEVVTSTACEEATLTFWQKLFHLFRLY